MMEYWSPVAAVTELKRFLSGAITATVVEMESIRGSRWGDGVL